MQFIKFYLVAGKGKDFKKLIYSCPQKKKKKTPFSFSGDLFFRQICPRSRDSVGRSQCRHIKHNHDWLALHVIHTKLAFSRVRLSTNASHEFQVVLNLTRSEKKGDLNTKNKFFFNSCHLCILPQINNGLCFCLYLSLNNNGQCYYCRQFYNEKYYSVQVSVLL